MLHHQFYNKQVRKLKLPSSIKEKKGPLLNIITVYHLLHYEVAVGLKYSQLTFATPCFPPASISHHYGHYVQQIPLQTECSS